ncbi:MAG: putative metalloprotease with PDZ domain [Paraglaciecola sp.]|jgi:predicted metalloprotease with PDZ domain
MHKFPFPLQYQVEIHSISGHTLSVTLDIAQPCATGQKVSLAVWIPGSYMIRDFSKNIIQLSAYSADGQSLNVLKSDKLSWIIAPHSGPIKVQYTVYAFDLSVRSAYLDDEFCFFNGTSLFLAVEGQKDSQCRVILPPPLQANCKDWRIATTLPLVGNTRHHEFGEYQASNYNELIDHPILMGRYDIVPFQATSGTENDPLDCQFELILAGGHQGDTERMAKDLSTICQHHFDLFADKAPIERYLFITMLTGDGFGGLEHSASTALLYNRHDLPLKTQSTQMPDGYRTFLSLCSHEFLHTWHVKRTKPVELENPALSEETYTEQLWIYEGFTSYYDDYSLQRCGVITTDSYLEVVAQTLTRLLRNQGRFKQSVTESSFDAWTKFYQQDASAINNIVSYYNKGAVIALCLDLHIRSHTQGKASLDDVMRYLWQHHGKTGIGTNKQVIHTVLSEHLQIPLDEFLNKALYSTEDLPVDELLSRFGIRCVYRPRTNAADVGGKSSGNTIKHDFGANIKAVDTGVKISQVVENTPAFASGLQVNDQLLSINHWQVNDKNLHLILDNLDCGQVVPLHILRHQQLKKLSLSIGEARCDTIYLEITDPDKLATWLT